MHDFFCGWYFRCQSDSKTLALIPAFHRSGAERSCSIQLITDGAAWNVRFPILAYQKCGSVIKIGENVFCEKGVQFDLQAAGLSAKGSLRFGPLTPIGYDIMGPFALVPFMQCRHSVYSMKHSVTGEAVVNGAVYTFEGGTGYLEGDRGRSFPRQYVWTQCSFPEGALMLSVADIPLGALRFTGVIGVVLWQGRQYRLASYLGAKALCIRPGEIVVGQGGLCLTARQLEQSPQPLAAPNRGAMTRTIHEHAACRASYRFEKNGVTLFSFEAPNAAFEYEYTQQIRR